MMTRGQAAWLMLVVVLVGLTGCVFFPKTEANIDLTALSGVVPLTITYSGNESQGPGGIDTWHWQFEDGVDIHAVSGEYTFRHAGTYEVTLIVRAKDGSVASETVQVNVEPAFWVADANLEIVQKLDLQGNVVTSLPSPGAQPQGVALVESGGQWSLYLACQGNGVQRIYRMDPVTGEVLSEFAAPAQSPAYLAYGALAPFRLWHVDAMSRQIYELLAGSGQFINAFGATYFQSSPNLGNVPFLQTPAGLAWDSAGGIAGALWLLEAETWNVHQLLVDPPINIFESVQLELQPSPIPLDSSVCPVAGMDWFDGFLWVIDRDRHRIAQIDPATGLPTGQSIGGFPGATASGLAIQR